MSTKANKIQSVHHFEYVHESRKFVIQPLDLFKMMAMNLGMLPVESIAIPEDSPLFGNRHSDLTASYDLSNQLSRFFPVSFVAALYEMQSLLAKAELKGFVIGGITRDMLLSERRRFDLTDVDITVEGDALSFAKFLTRHSRNYQIIEEFPEFGTVKVQYKDAFIVDLASTRKEVYPYTGALPEVVNRGVPLADDIIRRDFTVNALAFSINPLGMILDYSHGIEDIEAGVIRVLHPVSFYEDPSRILRALKFAIRFGFDLAEETRLLIEQLLFHGALVYKGGGDRIKYELKAFLMTRTETPELVENKDRWIRFFMENSCLQLANMELIRRPSNEKIERLIEISHHLPKLVITLEDLIPPEVSFDVYLCYLLADLPEDELEHTASRLGLTRLQREMMACYQELLKDERLTKLKEFSNATEIYEIFHDVPTGALLAGMLALHFEDKNRYKIAVDAFKTYKRKWERVEVELDGHELMDLGVPAGKPVGDMLKQLLNAKLSGRVNDRLSEVKFVQNQLQPPPQSE